MTIAADIQKLSPGDIVDLFELDASALGGSVTHYHAGNVADGVYGDIVWQGVTYSPFPLIASGFSLQTQGVLPRPHIRVANVSGVLGAMLKDYDDLVGAKVTRRRTLVKYLDAVNWTGINLLSAAEDFSNVVWSRLVGTSVTAGVRQTSAGIPLDQVTDSVTNDFGGVYQDVVIPSGTQNYVASCHIAKTAGGTAPTFGMNVYIGSPSFAGAGTEVRKWIRIDTDSGAIVDPQADVGVIDLGDCWRLWAKTANNGAPSNTTLRTILSPAVGPHAYTSDDASVTGSAIFGGAQVESGATVSDFGVGWSTPDPTASWPDEVWFIDRKVIENKVFIEFELVAAWDVTGVMLPRRQCTQNLCSWQYRGEGCGYAGPAVAKADDTPTTLLSEDRCSKKLSGCVLRFPTGDLTYGGFPGTSPIPL